MNLLPIYRDNAIIDGHFIHALPFCNKHCTSSRCASYYRKIENCGGYHCCPYGLSSFVDLETKTIFTGFRAKNIYFKEKSKRLQNDVKIYNPVMLQEQINELLSASKDSLRDTQSFEEKRAAVESVSHEAKKLNAQIKERCDILLQGNPYLVEENDSYDSDIAEIQTAIKTIYASSVIVDSRFTMFNYEKNPEVLKNGDTFECVVYKKFHKIQKIFKNYQKKNITINIIGESYAKINAFPSFELIPVLIVENAVKYAYSHDKSVEIRIDDDKQGQLTVDVISYSPYCSADDISHIFEKGFRGKNAKKVSSDGSGIGLYFVKLLCDIHDIEISITSDSKRITQISDIPYAPFCVHLKFHDVFY